MADNLNIFDVTYPNAIGIKAKNTGGTTLSFIRPIGSSTYTSNGIYNVTTLSQATISVPTGSADFIEQLAVDQNDTRVLVPTSSWATLKAGIQAAEAANAKVAFMPPTNLTSAYGTTIEQYPDSHSYIWENYESESGTTFSECVHYCVRYSKSEIQNNTEVYIVWESYFIFGLVSGVETFEAEETQYYYYDTSIGADALPADVLAGKHFYNADGYCVGTGSGGGGGGGSDGEDAFVTRAISGTYENSRVSYVGNHVFYIFSTITSFNFPNVTEVGSYAFYECSYLTDFNAPKLSSIKSNAFNRCYTLSSLTINYSAITSLPDYAFYNCSALPYASYSNVETIGSYAFGYCRGISSLSFPSLTTTLQNVFYGCTGLTNAYLPQLTSTNGGLFSGCTSLVSVDLPELTFMSASCFAGCSSLEYVNLPKLSSLPFSAFTGLPALRQVNIQSVPTIAASGFLSCYALTDVSAPLVEVISANAFNNCSALSTIYFPHLSYVWSSAFLKCSSLTTFIWGSEYSGANKLTIYGTSVFASCWRLMSFYLLNSRVVSLSFTTDFASTPISTYTTYTGGVNGSIFVPESLYSTYITTTNWAAYSDRFVSLTDAQVANVIANGTHII